MTLVLRDRFTHALVVPTSIGLRLTAVGAQPVHTSDSFFLQTTSAETNAASVASYLGLPVRVLTTFVKDSPISRLIKSNLASRGMTFEGKEVPQGGPWGYRHPFNIADGGFGARGPRVHNDRAGEVGRTLSVQDFDLGRLFEREGVQLLHMSGLIAALSPETGTFCLELARAARRHGTRVSFDLNYRPSFWEGRAAELRAIFTEIARLSDVLVGNEEEFQPCLGLEGPERGGRDLSEHLDDFKRMIERAQGAFPNVQLFATTLREVLSANRHLWGAIMWERQSGWHGESPREIGVLDRIGGGDGFVGGLLYGILKGWQDPKKWLSFGWACGAMAVTVLTDYAQPADEKQIWSIWEGNSRVVR